MMWMMWIIWTVWINPFQILYNFWNFLHDSDTVSKLNDLEIIRNFFLVTAFSRYLITDGAFGDFPNRVEFSNRWNQKNHQNSIHPAAMAFQPSNYNNINQSNQPCVWTTSIHCITDWETRLLRLNKSIYFIRLYCNKCIQNWITKNNYNWLKQYEWKDFMVYNVDVAITQFFASITVRILFN